MKCQVYKYLYKMIPIIRWQTFLMEHHFSRCPQCSQEFSDVAQIKSIGVTPGAIDPAVDLWPIIEDRLIHLENAKIMPQAVNKILPQKKSNGCWIMGTVTAVLSICLLIPPAICYITGPQEALGKEKKIIINSIRVENQSAEIFYFQTKNQNRLIVWVKKNIKET